MCVIATSLSIPFVLLIFFFWNAFQFLAGLLLLEPERDEFVGRKIKQIFSRYFHGYLQVVKGRI